MTLPDLQSEIDAVGPDEIPSRWTAAWVQIRLVHALDVIHRSTTKPGPRAAHTAWPAMVGGWQDLLDEKEQEAIVAREKRFRARSKRRGRLVIDWRSYVDRDLVSALEADAAEEAVRRGSEPMALEIELADEAALWPARYLADAPMEADALQLWAACQALGWQITRALQRRRAKADAMIAKRRRDAWDATFERASRFGFARDKAAALADKKSVDLVVSRIDVLPNRAMEEKTLERKRKAGADMLARRLNAARVSVR